MTQISIKELLRQRSLLYRIQKGLVFDLNRIIGDQGGGGAPVSTTPISYTNNIPFNSSYQFMNVHAVSGNIAFTVNSTNAVPGAVTVCKLVADGTSTISFTGIKEIIGSNYDNTLNILNYLVFFYDGANYFVNIYQEKDAQPVDIVAPVLQSAVVSDSVRNRITLTYNEDIDPASIPLLSAYTPSLKTVTGIAVVGPEVRITVNSNYANGDVIVLGYTAGASPIRDLNGNNAANLVAQAVTNNVAPPDLVAPTVQSATVDNGSPNVISIVFDEALDEAYQSAIADYTVSGGKTVTAVLVSEFTVSLTVNTPYANGDVITVSYAGVTNRLRDSNGNFVANISNQAVTNNISPSEITLAWEALSGTTYTPPELINSGSNTGGRATTTVDATQAFYIKTIVPTPATQTNATVTYLDSVNTATYNWTAGLVFRCGFYHYGGTLYASDGGYGATNTGQTVSAGNWIRMIKSGNDVLLQISTNSGGSWTTAYTFVDALLGQTTLYTKVIFATSESQRITVYQG